MVSVASDSMCLSNAAIIPDRGLPLPFVSFLVFLAFLVQRSGRIYNEEYGFHTCTCRCSCAYCAVTINMNAPLKRYKTSGVGSSLIHVSKCNVTPVAQEVGMNCIFILHW